MYPPKGSVDAQGHELQVGTNCLGHYLLYQLLLPLLTRTASTSSVTASVRVLWAASVAVHVSTPHPQGIVLEANGAPSDQGVTANYSQSKVGNVFLARECAKATPETGVVHAAFNPGNLRSELQRHWTGIGHWFTVSLHCPAFVIALCITAADGLVARLDCTLSFVYFRCICRSFCSVTVFRHLFHDCVCDSLVY